jgi:hypothetical protein
MCSASLGPSGGIGRAQMCQRGSERRLWSSGGAIKREAHGYRPAAIRLHDCLIAAGRHGELRNRGNRQRELVRDELAPRLDLNAIGL